MKKQSYPHNWEELLAGYVLGDLEPEEVTAMHQLISEHPEMIAKIDCLQETLALLPLGLSESAPASDLRDRIAAIAIPKEIENPSRELLVEAFPKVIRRSHSHINFWKLAWVGVGSMSAIALVALGFDNYQMRQQVATHQIELQKYRQAIAQLQGEGDRTILLKGMGAIPAATGSLTIAPTEKMATISIQNLIQIPQGNSYRLWAIVDGKKIDCAKFRPNEQGIVFVKVPIGNALRQSTTVVITIEPNMDMPEPTGEMVMKGEV